MMPPEANNLELDDFAFGERIINFVRWPLIGVFLLFNNLGFTEDRAFVWPINAALLVALALTGTIQVRLQRGHSFGWRVTLVLAAIQDGLITAGVYLTGLHQSHFFIFYYPSLLGFSLAFPLRASLAYSAVVGLVYAALTWSGVSGDLPAIKVLVERWLVMVIIVVIGGLLMHKERERRLQAIANESRTARENEQLLHNLSEKMERWRKIGQQVDRAAAQLCAAAQDLAGLADEIGAGCAGVTDVTEQMVNRATSNVGQVAAIGQEAKQILVAARQLADSASATGVASEQAQRAVSQAREAVQSLSQRSQAIGDLAAAVRQVADQTNLLAFNASIEAIQAGREGQRFAVVASEVRQVAERAIRLAREIDGLSFEVQQGTHQVLEAMSEIAGMVEQTSGLVDITSQTSHSQKSGAGAMANSVSALKSDAQQTASDVQAVSDAVQRQHAVLQRIAALSQELAASAGDLGALTDALAD